MFPINKLLLYIYIIVNIAYIKEKEKHTIIHSIKNSEITECNECFWRCNGETCRKWTLGKTPSYLFERVALICQTHVKC